MKQHRGLDLLRSLSHSLSLAFFLCLCLHVVFVSHFPLWKWAKIITVRVDDKIKVPNRTHLKCWELLKNLIFWVTDSESCVLGVGSDQNFVGVIPELWCIKCPTVQLQVWMKSGYTLMGGGEKKNRKDSLTSWEIRIKDWWNSAWFSPSPLGNR